MAAHPEDNRINIFTGVYQHFIPAAPGISAELDMGCGSGSFTIALAKKYPERKIIAADVMLGRLRKVVRKMERNKIENMDILRVIIKRKEENGPLPVLNSKSHTCLKNYSLRRR